MQYQGLVVQDRYEVGDWLGQGSAATVCRARDLRLDRAVAIKLLRPELRADPAFVTRFAREARCAAQLSHPHIVPIYDYGEVAGTFFIVMEYIAGGDLRARLHAGQPLPVAEAVRLAIEVAEGLGAAHAVGIVHRDVKPGNILLARDGRAKITDFGIVKMIGVPTVTMVSLSLGTPHYAAPEQTSGGEITPATDVYALGVVLFEMLAGRLPFEGSSLIEVAMQHLQAPPPALSRLNPAVPTELEAILAQALAKEPRERFPDGTSFAAALREQERALGHLEEAGPGAPAITVRLATLPRADAPAGSELDPVGARAESESTSAAFAGAPASVEGHTGPDPRTDAAPPRMGQAGVETREPANEPVEPPAITPLFTQDEGPLSEVPSSRARGYERRGVPIRPAVLGRARTESRSRAAAVVAGVIFFACGLALFAATGGLGRRGAADTIPPTSDVAGVTAVRTPDTSGEMPGITIVETTTAAPAGASGPAPSTAPAAAATSAPAAPTGAPTSEPTATPAPLGREVVVDDDAFRGGFSAPRNYRGRTARWVYGALGPYDTMTASFTIDGTPGTGELLLKGIDSEGGAPTPMEIRINDTVIYQGGNPLPKETWRGPVAPWGEATFPIPDGVLHGGRNIITISNLAPVNNFNAPPYVMVDAAVISY